MAVSTLAVDCAAQPAVVALAVPFDAVRFLARAALDRHEGLDVFEVAGVPIVGHHFGGFDLPLVSGLVQAASTRAVGAAHLPLIEAVAVELEASDLRALAALSLV